MRSHRRDSPVQQPCRTDRWTAEVWLLLPEARTKLPPDCGRNVRDCSHWLLWHPARSPVLVRRRVWDRICSAERDVPRRIGRSSPPRPCTARYRIPSPLRQSGRLPDSSRYPSRFLGGACPSRKGQGSDKGYTLPRGTRM